VFKTKFGAKLLIDIQHFNIKLMHTMLKNVELLKHFKISNVLITNTRNIQAIKA